jgi:hypothetical protein
MLLEVMLNVSIYTLEQANEFKNGYKIDVQLKTQYVFKFNL